MELLNKAQSKEKDNIGNDVPNNSPQPFIRFFIDDLLSYDISQSKSDNGFLKHNHICGGEILPK